MDECEEARQFDPGHLIWGRVGRRDLVHLAPKRVLEQRHKEGKRGSDGSRRVCGSAAESFMGTSGKRGLESSCAGHVPDVRAQASQ